MTTEITLTERLKKPFLTLIDLWWLKAAGAAVTAIVVELLRADPKFLVLVAVLITLDLVTGVWRALRSGSSLSSLRLRQTGIKAAEYMILLVAVGMVANAFGQLRWMQEGAFMYVAVTELVSIIENVFGRRAKKIIKHLRNFVEKNDGNNQEDNKAGSETS